MKLGKVQELEIAKITENGAYLFEPNSPNKRPADRQPEDLAIDRILLPKNQTPKDAKPGMRLTVFLYRDSEDRPIATTSIPPLTLGGLAVLPVMETSPIGAFLGWGLAKDLLLPFKEQTVRVNRGDYVLVALYIDKSQRLCATTKVYDYLRTDSGYQANDKVSGTVYEIIDAFGAFVAVDNKYSALIPKQELFCELKPGGYIEARITKVHEDGKLTLSLRNPAYLQLGDDAAAVYQKLTAAGGFLPYHDKTDPEIIKQEFSLSKNAFKRAIGRLMKEGKISILDAGIQIKTTKEAPPQTSKETQLPKKPAAQKGPKKPNSHAAGQPNPLSRH